MAWELRLAELGLEQTLFAEAMCIIHQLPIDSRESFGRLLISAAVHTTLKPYAVAAIQKLVANEGPVQALQRQRHMGSVSCSVGGAELMPAGNPGVAPTPPPPTDTYAMAAAGAAAWSHLPDESWGLLKQLVQPLPATALLNGDGLSAILDLKLPALLPIELSGVPLLMQFAHLNEIFYPPGMGRPAHRLAMVVTNALSGPLVEPAASSGMWAVTTRVVPLLDCILDVICSCHSLPIKFDRGASGATAAQQRPAFLMWHNNALVFKGEETADEKHFAAAVAKLSSRMDQAWDPALPVGAKQPCMLAYVAAGSKLQFFCVKNQGDEVQVTGISRHFDMSSAPDRALIIQCVFNIARLLAGYEHPHVPFALGQRDVRRRTTIIIYPDFVGKHVKGFGECAPFNDLALLTDVYKGTAGGAGIIQLQDGPPRVVDGIYKVLLRPKGRCWGCAPTDLTCLKAAVRGVLTGLATLHSAGFVHRDVCWDNLIEVLDGSGWLLIDLEHAGRAGTVCTGHGFPLRHWGDGVLERDGSYTPASDLVMVAQQLLAGVSDGTGRQLRAQLLARQLPSAEAALQHPWFSELTAQHSS